jgi:arsenate reductase-like glutaredoxin family protein
VKEDREVEYFDVLSNADKLNTMLKYSDGTRKVPVIVDHGKVAIGFNGRS